MVKEDIKFLFIGSLEDSLSVVYAILKSHGEVIHFKNFDEYLKYIKNEFSKEEKFVYVIDANLSNNSAIQLLKKIRDIEKDCNGISNTALIVSEDENAPKLMNMFSLREDVFIKKDITEDDLKALIEKQS